MHLPADTAQLLVEAAFSEIAEVERLMSPKAPGEDVRRVLEASAGDEIALHPLTAAVLRLAESIHLLSDGVFDIARTQRTGPAARYCWISENRIQINIPGLLDLGGIAKGFAVDRAQAILREGGVAWAMVDAGGDAAAFGQPQWFSIRHPLEAGASIGGFEFSDCALATSSAQFTTHLVNGETQHHLFDPRINQFGPLSRSVTVIAASCVLADALTKVVYFLGTAAAPALKNVNAQGWLWDEATGWVPLA